MKTTASIFTAGTPTEIDQRRPLSANERHEVFIKGISTPARHYDAIDEALDDLIEVDPYVSGTSNRRSDKELNRMLDLIDNLPISDSGKDGSH